MTVTCPYCGKLDVLVFEECPGCNKIVDMDDIARPLPVLLELLETCPKCKRKAFDGHTCQQCYASISDKAKTAHPSVLVSEKERYLVRDHFKYIDG